MKTMTRLILISMLMVVASPAYSEAIQIFNCELEGEATYDDVNAIASKWLKVAKTVKGGENLQAFIRHPIAASSGDIDFKFVIATPNFADWGTFTDAYEDSPVADVDDEFDNIASCNDASLWEGEEIK